MNPAFEFKFHPKGWVSSPPPAAGLFNLPIPMCCAFGIGVSQKMAMAFAAMAIKKKSHGSSFDLPTAVLVYFTLPKPPQQRADQCKIGIKPITINIVVYS